MSVAPRQLLATFAAADLDAFAHATHAVLRAAVVCEYATAVKFLLHRTYQKTGVPNRAVLVAVLRQDRSAVID